MSAKHGELIFDLLAYLNSDENNKMVQARELHKALKSALNVKIVNHTVSPQLVKDTLDQTHEYFVSNVVGHSNLVLTLGDSWNLKDGDFKNKLTLLANSLKETGRIIFNILKMIEPDLKVERMVLRPSLLSDQDCDDLMIILPSETGFLQLSAFGPLNLKDYCGRYIIPLIIS